MQPATYLKGLILVIAKLNAGWRRAATVGGTALAASLGLALPASAHTPVMLDSTDVLPWISPLAQDGSDPIAFFGVLPNAGADRSFQFDMQAGQTVNITTLIPDLAPENQLSDALLPQVAVIDPNFNVTVLKPTMHLQVPIPELNENYVILNNYLAPAVPGRYSVVVYGLAPARFNISIGTEGGDFDGIERGSVGTIQQIQQWYATAP